MHFDIEQAGILTLPHFRRSSDGREQLALVDDAQPPGTLGDQDPAVRQEREPPRRLELPGEHLDLELLLFRRDHLTVGIGDELRAWLEGRGLRAQIRDELPDLLIVQHVLERDHLRLRHALRDHRRDAFVIFCARPLVIEQTRRAARLRGRPVARRAALIVHGGSRIATAAAGALHPARRRVAACRVRRTSGRVLRSRRLCRRRLSLLRSRHGLPRTEGCHEQDAGGAGDSNAGFHHHLSGGSDGRRIVWGYDEGGEVIHCCGKPMERVNATRSIANDRARR